MTWWTEAGNVVPPNPVIDLLVNTAAGLRDEIMEEIRYEDAGLQPETGVPAFDDLDPRTRIFALVHVLRHLSDADLESPDLYAWNEGTLWALFKRVEIDISLEIEFEKPGKDDGEKYGTRKLVLGALASYGQSVRRYSCRSRNVRLWGDHLEMIYTHLFWDMDCLDDDIFGDMEPARAEALKDELGIDPDYFSTPPPLVREEDFLEADAYLRKVGGYGQSRSSRSG